jgi:hypothetical protein
VTVLLLVAPSQSGWVCGSIPPNANVAMCLELQVGMCTGQDKATGRFLVQLRGPDASTVKVKGMNLEINSEPSRVGFPFAGWRA